MFLQYTSSNLMFFNELHPLQFMSKTSVVFFVFIVRIVADNIEVHPSKEILFKSSTLYIYEDNMLEQFLKLAEVNPILLYK